MFHFFIFFTLLSPQQAYSFSSKPLEENAVYKTWEGPFQGVPAFDKIEVEDFKPAIEATMERAEKTYESIANNPKEPTFENTMIPMEEIYLDMYRLELLFSIWSSNLSNKEIQEVETEIIPKQAAFQDRVVQNPKLFSRIKKLYESKEKNKWTPEQKRLVTVTYERFVKQGAALTESQKQQVAELNKRQAQLTTQFSQNLLGDENEDHLHITDAKGIEGLPQWLIDSAKQEAEKRKLTGWVIANTRSSMQPFVTYSPNRSLREKAFKIWMARGDNDNKYNNNKIINEILKLRAKRSKIMGFESYAHWQLSDKMAKDPQAAMDLMLKVWKPAIKQVKKDVKAMQAIVDKEKGGFKIAPWDYRYYAEKLRKARYDFDMDSVKPYLQVPNIQKAMFWMAKELYGFEFTPLQNIPVYHPEVTVFKVTKNNKDVGLWYFDPYARQGKRSGAWMNAYRLQHRLNGQDILPIVSNNSNFVKAAPGETTLISWDDAQTMFHEFGHALHGLSSNVTYPSLAGTQTARDFVEFPSQIHEDWLSTPEVLKFLGEQKRGALSPEADQKAQTSLHIQ
jgi:peptidyl-dipeptidase Dcp